MSPTPEPALDAAAPTHHAGAAAGQRSFYGWRIVRTLAITETISWGILYYAFAVLQVPMRADLGFSPATLTGAFSLAVAVTGLAAVPAGRWVDRHGARALMTTGSVAAVLLVLAWSRVHTVTGLYLVFAGLGLVSAAVLYEPAFAVVVRWFHTQRTKALLGVTLVAGFASTIFLPTTQALAQALGWRSALLVLAGVLAVGTVIPHAFVLRRDPADLGLRPDGTRGPAVPHDANSTNPALQALRATARWAFADRRFQLLTLGYAAHTLVIIVVSVHLVPFLREHGHSATFAAAATGALGLLSVTGRLTVTGAVRRWSVATVTATTFLLQGAATLLLLGYGNTTAGAVAFVFLFGLGFGVGTITRPALLADAYGSTGYATLSALVGIALTVAKTIGPVSAGLVRTSTGSYTDVLLAVVALSVLAATAVHFAGRRGTDTGAP